MPFTLQQLQDLALVLHSDVAWKPITIAELWLEGYDYSDDEEATLEEYEIGDTFYVRISYTEPRGETVVRVDIHPPNGDDGPLNRSVEVRFGV